MNITSKNRIPSPFQVISKPLGQRPEQIATVRDEVKKLLGTYQFSATFEEDTQTATTLNHIPGIIAFVCTIRKGDRVIGQGRGTTAISQVNRFIVKTINYAFNASLVDAVVRSTKILDAFRPDTTPHCWKASGAVMDAYEGITEKQKAYLLQLIQATVADKDEREALVAQVDEYTKEEASEAIKRFAK